MEHNNTETPSDHQLENEQNRTQMILYAMASVFFLIGFLIDSIRYIQDESWFLLATNLPIIVAIIISTAVKFIIKKNKLPLDLICLILITTNIIYSYWDTVLFDHNIDYGIMRLSTLSIAIVACTGFLLSRAGALFFMTLFAVNYIALALYSHSENLMDNIIMIPIVFIGISLWSNQYVHLYKKNTEMALKYKDERNRLNTIIESDHKNIRQTLDRFQQINSDNLESNQKEEVSNCVKLLSTIANYNLPNLVKQHATNIHSDQNLFINKILKKHPKLSASELKLAYMLVAGLRTKEIAEASMCTTDSIRVFRTRLRKKLELKHGENLVNYLRQFNSHKLSENA